jgi:outer membrane lipoprotein
MRLLAIRPLLALALVAACARPPARLATGPFAEVTVAEAQQRDVTGVRVRWGGEVVTVEVGERETCFEMVSRPLDRFARPRDTDDSDGRFLACAPGFYDPAVYDPGRAVTFVGTVAPSVVRRIGDLDYRYPRLQVETVHLWPKRPEREVVYYDPWFRPWSGAYLGIWPYGVWYR